MDSRIPAIVQPMLQDYAERLQTELPDLLTGLYIHGSIAYGGFCADSSDIDLLAVTTGRCTAQDLQTLRHLHAAVKAQWPRWKLEVSYVPLEECDSANPRELPPHPFHKDGEFVDSGLFDFNHRMWAANLWWMVKTRGIALLGPEPAELGIRVTADDIVATSRYLVQHYWPDWTRPRGNWFKLRQSFYRLSKPEHVDWVVFGTLRTYYTLREHDLTSKLDAADYGLAHLPRRWHKLIRENVANRQQPVERPFLVRAWKALVTAVYLRFILRECRRLN